MMKDQTRKSSGCRLATASQLRSAGIVVSHDHQYLKPWIGHRSQVLERGLQDLLLVSGLRNNQGEEEGVAVAVDPKLEASSDSGVRQLQDHPTKVLSS